MKPVSASCTFAEVLRRRSRRARTSWFAAARRILWVWRSVSTAKAGSSISAVFRGLLEYRGCSGVEGGVAGNFFDASQVAPRL